jgi:transcription elongation factor
MAVINNRIVHEGEMVDKGLIVRIDKDSVIVRRDGEEWRVHFDLK